MDYNHLALQAAKKSFAKKRKVGAVVVYDAAVWASGHNYHPEGKPCELEDGSTDPKVIHAEIAALANFASRFNTPPHSIYITHSPCENCKQAILNSGIKPEDIFIVEEFLKFDELKSRIDLLPSSVKHFIPLHGYTPMFFSAYTDSNKKELIRIGDNLLSITSIYEVGKILAYGAKKYKPNNWRNVDDIARYWAALGRHLWFVDKDVESVDEESGFLHASHALTNILFILELWDKFYEIKED